MNKVGYGIFIALFLVSASLVCSEKINIVSTISIPADFARQVGGEKVEVTSIVSGSADPHTYSSKPSDLEKIQNAHIILKMGLKDLEPWLDSAVSSTSFNTSNIIDLKNNITIQYDPIIDADNPHYWMSPDNAKIMVYTITAALITRDPTNAAYYEANRDVYCVELDALKARIIAKFTNYSSTKVVVNHPAFMYLFDIIGVVRIDAIEKKEGSEPSAQDIASIISKMKSENCTIVVTNYQRVSSEVKQIARETDSTIVELTPLLTKDHDSYISMIEYNVDELIYRIEYGNKEESTISIELLILISVVVGVSLLGVVLLMRYR